MFIMDLDLLLARLEAGSGAPLRDFFDSIPVSKSIEPSRRRLEAVGIAILEKNTALKSKIKKRTKIKGSYFQMGCLFVLLLCDLIVG